MEAREILEQVKTGNMSVEEAEKYFRRQPCEDLGYPQGNPIGISGSGLLQR